MSGDPRSLLDLTGRVAFVTGAGSGLGRRIATVLMAAGAYVACADLDEQAAAATVRQGPDAGARGEAVGVDVTDRDAVLGAVAAVDARHGRFDVMCNVAGIPSDGAHVVDIAEREFDRVMSVHVKGVLFGSQAAARVMIPHGSGSIVNMASTAIDTPQAGLGSYIAAKAAVAALTKVLAQEVGPSNIRANCVAPGWVETPLSLTSTRRPDGSVDESLREEMAARMADMAALRRVGVADDVAHQVLYLASDASAFVTGQTLRPNGGVSMPW